MNKKKTVLLDVSIKEIDTKIKELNEKRSALFPSRDKINDQIVSYYRKINKLHEEKSKIITSRKTIDWKYLLYEDGYSIDNVRYSLLNKELNKLNLSSSGYFPKIKQTTIRFHLYKNNKEYTSKVLNSLNKIIPYLKKQYLKDLNKKVIIISIFEKDLSAGGIYNLAYDPEGKKALVFKTTYGTSNKITKWNTLKNTLDYIQENIYYE